MTDYISYEEFAKLKLRVATIVEAGPHPNADKLMILRVDLGEEGKHSVPVVAGIKKHYQAEDLIGRRIVVLINLPPTTLRGENSEAMLLAASDDEGNLSLIDVDKNMKPGSIVR